MFSAITNCSARKSGIMAEIRVLVCDDEPLALRRLADMLGRCGRVNVVAATTDPATAIDQAIKLSPDAIFLDIEMPGYDGFDVLEELSKRLVAPASVPIVVFVTAHSHFALQAFESGVTDFLAKPVRMQRLEATLARLRAALVRHQAESRLQELQEVVRELRRRGLGVGGENEHLWIQRRGEFVRVELHAVDWVAAEGEYVRLHVGESSYLHRELIGGLETRLDQQRFLRIHRSTIVQVSRVVAIARSRHGGSVVRLKSGLELPVGRKYSKQTRQVLMLRGDA